MNQDQYKCNKCGTQQNYLFINCEVAFLCDDFSKYNPNKVKLLNHKKQKFEFLCENCNQKIALNSPLVQKEINQLKSYFIVETSRVHSQLQHFKKHLIFIDKIKEKQKSLQKYFETDVANQLEQLQKVIDISLVEHQVDFILSLKNQMKDEIKQSKVSEQNIIKSQQQYFETNQNLINSKQLSINDTIKYFKGQVDNLKITEKESLYQDIHRLLPEQPNPQNK